MFPIKDLKKLADACRKTGITKFKCQDFEFELSPVAPESEYKKRKKQKSYPTVDTSTDVETDAISQDDLLMWSSNAEIQINENN